MTDNRRAEFVRLLKNARDVTEQHWQPGRYKDEAFARVLAAYDAGREGQAPVAWRCVSWFGPEWVNGAPQAENIATAKQNDWEMELAYRTPTAPAVPDEDALRAALEVIESTMNAAYHNASAECCGRQTANGECCGEPIPAWSPEDTRIMDVLAPAQRALANALNAHRAETLKGTAAADGWREAVLDLVADSELKNDPDYPAFVVPYATMDAACKAAGFKRWYEDVEAGLTLGDESP